MNVPFRKRGFRRTQRNLEISPDEILLDAHNLPDFDQHRFEGRLEKPILRRNIFFVFGVFTFVFFICVAKLWSLQIVYGETFAEKSENNSLRQEIIFAERGTVVDRFDVPLIWNEPRDASLVSKRMYIDKGGFSHLLGYVSYPKKDSAGYYYQDFFEGKDGLEMLYNNELKGENGEMLTETNAKGEIQSQSSVRFPVDGEKIKLSIDSRVQAELFKNIEQLSSKVGFSGGAAGIVDIESGELLALTSYPEFTSQAMSDGNSSQIAAWNKDTRKPYLDRALGGLYTPGSIVKPFVSIGALMEGVIDPKKQILSTGQIEVPNPYDPKQKTVFKDWKAHGLVDMRRAIAVSSDVYFYEVGGGFQGQRGLGITNLEKYFRLFGMGSTTGVDLQSEKSGTIPNPAWKAINFPDDTTWRLGDTYHTAIGQYGVQVTPIEMLRATASLVNGGKLVTPTFRKIDVRDAVYTTLDIPEVYFQIAREGMRGSVEYGTATGLNVPYVKIAAKTGTAQLGYHNEAVNSWVMGFFPYEKPRYAFIALMERGPLHNTLGGTYVMRQTFDWMQEHTPEYFGNSPKKPRESEATLIATGSVTNISPSPQNTDVPEVPTR